MILLLVTLLTVPLTGETGAVASSAEEVCTYNPEASPAFTGGVPTVWRAVMVLVNDRGLPTSDLSSGDDVQSFVLDTMPPWWDEVSYGRFTFGSTLITPGDPSDPATSWFADRETAFAAADAALDLCDRDIIIWGLTSFHASIPNAGGAYTGVTDFPVNDACGVVTLGEIDMYDYQRNGRFGWFAARTFGLSHEVGHSLNLGHANFLSSNDGWTASAYGNHYGTMGGSFGHHFQSELKDHLGWFEPGEVIDVVADGTYEIAALALPPAAAAGRARSLTILQSETPGVGSTVRKLYSVDFRAAVPGTHDSGLAGRYNLPDGVLIKLTTQTVYDSGAVHTASVLLDATPESPNSIVGTDAALTVGRCIHLSDPGVVLTTTAVTSDQATVEVRFDDGSNQPPVSPGISLEILDKTIGEMRLTANASDPDGDPLSYHWVFDTRGGDFEQGDYGWGQSQTLVVGTAPAPLSMSVLISDRRGGTARAKVNLFGHANSPPAFPGGGPGFDFDGLRFTSNVSDDEGDRLYFRWDFGDGQVWYVPNPRYEHEDPGLDGFTVTMDVSDGESVATEVQQVYPNVAPVADAGGNRTITMEVPAPCIDVTLDGSGSFDPDGSISLYAWVYGSEVLGLTPQVTYCFPLGTHDVQLFVLDDGIPQRDDVDGATLQVKKAGTRLPAPQQ